MAHRNVHYEAAFEDYLRAKGWPYVVVDDAKKAIFADVALKSFDFIVYSESGRNLLVDVKGRKFPDTSTTGRKRGPTRAWENWITQEDADGLRDWQRVFGDDFQPTLVFTYWLQGPPHAAPFDDVHVFRQEHYAFVGVSLEEYLAIARPRSAKWATLAAPAVPFRTRVRDIGEFL